MTQLLENAAAGTALILTVVLLRRVLKDRFLPEIRLFLWAACLFRLLTPAAPQSVLSLWGLVSRSAPAAPAPNRSITFSVPRPAPTETATTQANAWSLSSLLPVLKTVLVILWLAVGVILAARYVWSWLSVRREVRSTTLLARPGPRYGPLPRCARLREGPMDGAPLTFGAARPTIVLAPGLSGPQLDCVLAHEGVHARRRDNLWHYAMGAVQVIYWWNPAVWLMARLLRTTQRLRQSPCFHGNTGGRSCFLPHVRPQSGRGKGICNHEIQENFSFGYLSVPCAGFWRDRGLCQRPHRQIRQSGRFSAFRRSR